MKEIPIIDQTKPDLLLLGSFVPKNDHVVGVA